MRMRSLALACLVVSACTLDELPGGGGGTASTESTSSNAASTSIAASTSTASTATSASTGTAAPLLKGLAWNIETFPKSASAPDGVRTVLADADADLVGVVEITDTVGFTAIAAELGYAAVFNQQDDFQRIGILHRESVVTVTDVESLFIGEDYAFPRPPIKGHVTLVDRPDVDFDFIVVHLKAQIDVESQARRRAACNRLDAWMRARVADGGDPDIMVVGDMNDDLTDLPGDNVFVPFLTQPELYRFLTLDPEKAGGVTYLPFQRFLDHVLVTRDMDAEIGTGAAEVLEPDATLPGYEDDVSDHRPVAFTFR